MNQKSESVLKLEREIKRGDLILFSFVKLNEFSIVDKNVYDILKYCYESDDNVYQVLGVLLNGAINSDKKRFFVSVRTLNQYFESDPNIKNKQFNSSTLGRSILHLTSGQILKEIEDINQKYKKNKAKIYEFTYPIFVQEIDQKIHQK